MQDPLRAHEILLSPDTVGPGSDLRCPYKFPWALSFHSVIHDLLRPSPSHQQPSAESRYPPSQARQGAAILAALSTSQHFNQLLGSPSRTGGANTRLNSVSHAQGIVLWRCRQRRLPEEATTAQAPQGGFDCAGAPRRLRPRRRRSWANMAAAWLLLRVLRQGQGRGPDRLRGPCWGWGPGLSAGAGRRWPYLVHGPPMGVARSGGRALQVTPVAQTPLWPGPGGGSVSAPVPNWVFPAWVFVCLYFLPVFLAF